MRIVVFSGRRRMTFDMAADRQHRRDYGQQLKRFLFPTEGSFHKARKRGERALAVML